jgi:zinc transport system substrate-binding protein
MARRFVFVVGFFLATAAALGENVGWPSEALPVFVSILPQKYFVDRIGGNSVEVSVMVRPGASPADYEPKPQQMVGLSRAKAYFAIGVPFEKAWLDRIAAANPRMRVFHTEAGIEKRTMRGHSHGGGEQDTPLDHRPRNESGRETIRDPHIWLSPPLVMLQARSILNGLIAVDPSNQASYDHHFREFILECLDLDRDIRRILSERNGRREFMVFHPAWGYFAEAYGLEQVPVEVEGKEPKPAELKRLIGRARERGIKVVFVQPQFSTRNAEMVAEAIGGRIAVADPLAPDWAANLRRTAEALASALK